MHVFMYVCMYVCKDSVLHIIRDFLEHEDMRVQVSQKVWRERERRVERERKVRKENSGERGVRKEKSGETRRVEERRHACTSLSEGVVLSNVM